MGLFYAWDATVRYQNDIARVNLLLNRASPWLDVDSYLPYEGKVVIHNKTAQKVYLRIPLWVDIEMVKCQVDDKAVKPGWFGRYLLFEKLNKNSKLTITFPMAERTEKFGPYTARFKGNTVIDITPEVSGYPTFRRDHLKADKAPRKKKMRYVSDEQITIW